MVAVASDPAPWSAPRSRPARATAPGRPSVVAPAGPAVPVGATQRLLLVVAVIAVVVVVAVGTAAFGRVLDTHRGIPAAPAAASSPS
jgi:hypothetical protein